MFGGVSNLMSEESADKTLRPRPKTRENAATGVNGSGSGVGTLRG